MTAKAFTATQAHWQETEQLTIAATIDELYLCLMRETDDLYFKQAEMLIGLIPIERPHPIFQIRISDLSKQVKKELDDRWNNKMQLDFILKEAVGKVFECVDEKYFFQSVKKLLRVELIS